MPFTALRSFFLFLFSWAILGVGIYLAYDLIQGYRHDNSGVAVERVDVDGQPETIDQNQVAADQPLVDERQSVDQRQIVIVHARESNWSRLAKLAGVLACFGITFGGRLPLKWMMKRGKVQTNVMQPFETFEVSRPDGTRLHGEIFGNKQGPTLVLTHGWSLNSSAWQYLRVSLAKRYRVVVWDLAGLGKSKGPTNHDYSLEKLANDLNAVVGHVATNGHVVLVGHSIGGMTQQTFCRLHGDKLGTSVQGIVLLHTTYTNPLSTNMLAWIIKPLEPLVSLMNFVMIPLAPVMWLSNWQSYFNGSAHWAARFESFTGKQSWEQLDHSARMGALAWPGVVARGNMGMMKFNEEQTLPDVHIPVLVVSGVHDRLTVQSASRHISQLLPDDTQVSDEGGHLGYWEYNDQISDAIQRFANQVFKNSTTQLVS